MAYVRHNAEEVAACVLHDVAAVEAACVRDRVYYDYDAAVLADDVPKYALRP
ncbi:MAG: hypothetical protein K2G25_00535 [Oscillospiraceae bacterium]|nr:hypothetical protein [Oscillospiraceae bacterium]